MSRTPLASTATTFGCVSRTRGSILCAICAALAKKIGPSGLSSRRPGKLSSSGCSGDSGRKTLVPGLRRRTYTGGSATWYASVTRDGGHPEDRRANALHDALDHPAFAGCVSSFENDHDAGVGRLDPVLELDQLNL